MLALPIAVAALMVLPAGSALGAVIVNAHLGGPAASSGPAALPDGPVAGSTPLGAVDPSMPVSLMVFLNGNEPGLDSYLASIQNPSSSLYRTYVSPTQFGTLFGAPAATLSSVTTYFASYGLTARAESNGFIVRVSGPAASVGAALGVSFGWYRYDGNTYYSATGSPSLPSSFASSVSTILGLNSFPLAPFSHTNLEVNPAFARARASSTTPLTPATATFGGITAYGPNDTRTVYNATTLENYGFNGTGTTVAIVEWAFTTSPSNVAAYNSYFDLPQFNTPHNPTLTYHFVDGPTTQDNTEVALDIEAVHAMAPGANVVVVSGSNPTAPTYQIADDYDYVFDTLEPALHGSAAPLVATSTSWGTDTLPYTPLLKSVYAPLFTAMDHLFSMGAAEGVTTFASSGDSGADNYSDLPNTSWPVLDPFVTAAGGTTLLPRMVNGTTDAWGAEEAWGNTWSDGADFGSGGGIASSAFGNFVHIPSYQKSSPAVAACAQCSKSQRNEPDVAANANFVSSPFWVYDGGFEAVGGTSESSPLWAGFWADIESVDYAVNHHYLSWANPLLYSAEATNAAAFHSITVGTNGAYTATGAYNLVDGLGSPNVTVLAETLTGWNPLNAQVVPSGMTYFYESDHYVPPGSAGYWMPLGGQFEFLATLEGNWVSPVVTFQFGDGTTGSNFGMPYIFHVYNSPGVYKVNATVKDNSGAGPTYVATTTVWVTAVQNLEVTVVQTGALAEVPGTEVTVNGDPVVLTSSTVPPGATFTWYVPASTNYNASTYTIVASAPGYRFANATVSVSPSAPEIVTLTQLPGANLIGPPTLNASYQLLDFANLTGSRTNDPEYAVTGKSPPVETMPLLPFNQSDTQWFPTQGGWVTDFYGNLSSTTVDAMYTPLVQPFNNYEPEYASLMQSTTYGYLLYTLNNLTVLNTPVGPNQIAAGGFIFADAATGNELEVVGAALGAEALLSGVVGITLPTLGGPPISFPLPLVGVPTGAPVYAILEASVVAGKVATLGEQLSPKPFNQSIAVLTNGLNQLTVWNNFALTPSPTACGQTATNPCTTPNGPVYNSSTLNLSIPRANLPVLVMEVQGSQDAPATTPATAGPYSATTEGFGVWSVQSAVAGTVSPTSASVYVNGNPETVSGGTFREFDTESPAVVTVTAPGHLPQTVVVQPPLWGTATVSVTLHSGSLPTGAPTPAASLKAKLRYFETLQDPSDWWTDWAYPFLPAFGQNWFITSAGLDTFYNGTASPLQFSAYLDYANLTGAGFGLTCTTSGKGVLLCPEYGVTINDLSFPTFPGSGYNGYGYVDPTDGNALYVANENSTALGNAQGQYAQLLFYNASTHTVTVLYSTATSPSVTYSLVANGRGYIAWYATNNFAGTPIFSTTSGPILHELDPMIQNEYVNDGPPEVLVDQGVAFFTF